MLTLQLIRVEPKVVELRHAGGIPDVAGAFGAKGLSSDLADDFLMRIIVEALIHLESFFIRRAISGQAIKNINRILLGASPELRDGSPSARHSGIERPRDVKISLLTLRSGRRSDQFRTTGLASCHSAN